MLATVPLCARSCSWWTVEHSSPYACTVPQAATLLTQQGGHSDGTVLGAKPGLIGPAGAHNSITRTARGSHARGQHSHGAKHSHARGQHSHGEGRARVESPSTPSGAHGSCSLLLLNVPAWVHLPVSLALNPMLLLLRCSQLTHQASSQMSLSVRCSNLPSPLQQGRREVQDSRVHASQHRHMLPWCCSPAAACCGIGLPT